MTPPFPPLEVAITISTTANSTVFLGNGATAVFGFNFIADSAADIQVIYTNTSNVSVVLSPSQYTLAINAPAAGAIWGVGGTCTYPITGSPIPNGSSITIERLLPLTQTTSISNQGDFYPQVVEAALDTLCMEGQQTANQISRALQVAVYDPGGNPNPLPIASVRANGLLGFDAAGQPAIYGQGTSAGSATNVNYLPTWTGAISRTVQVRLMDQMSVKDFGATGNGLTDDTAAINLALTAAATAAGSNGGQLQALYFPSGTYKISSSLTVDVSKIILFGQGSIILSGTFEAFTLTGTVNLSGPHAHESINDFYIVGPGIATSSGGIICTGSPSVTNAGSWGVNIRNVSITACGTGLTIGNNAFCINYFGGQIVNTATPFTVLAGVFNSGERYSFFGTFINNCGNGANPVFSVLSPAEIYCESCSIDYNYQIINMSVNTTLMLQDCHIEQGDWTVPAIVKGGNGSFFVMNGGQFLVTQASTLTAAYYVDNSAESATGQEKTIFQNVTMKLAHTSTDYFANGPGYIEIIRPNFLNLGVFPRLGTSPYTNQMADGSFEATTANGGPLDDVYIEIDINSGGPYPKAVLAGTNITISNSTDYSHSGSQSLKLATASAAAGAGDIAIPIKPGQFPCVTFYIRKPGTATGTLTILTMWANNKINTNQTITPGKSQTISNLSFVCTSADTGWVMLQSTGPQQGVAPKWATNLVIRVDMKSLSAAAAVYVDDVVMEGIG